MHQAGLSLGKMVKMEIIILFVISAPKIIDTDIPAACLQILSNS